MFRVNKSKCLVQPAITMVVDAKKQDDYALYLLPNNRLESLEEIKIRIKSANAVLLYPDSKNTSNSPPSKPKYKACFIQNGKPLVNEKKELIEVNMGSEVLNEKRFFILKTKPNYENIIKMALSKARIQLPTILKTPQAVIKNALFPNMDEKAMAAFSQTSFYASTLTKPVLTKQKLLNYVIRGQESEAKKMLETNPRLLLERGVVTDYSGRQIEGTAFQLALGAEDAEMCEMMSPYFNRLAGGEAERLKQYQVQFPEEKEKKENGERHEEPPEIAALRQLFQTIGASRTDKECEGGLVAFRELLKPQGVIKTGKHFNGELLQTAFQLYNENYDAFGGWNSRKNNVCWRKVIGYIQRFLPACYAQAFCQGLWDLAQGREVLRRSLEFRYDPRILFFPLSASREDLGHDFVGGGGGVGCGRRVCIVPRVFSELMSSKNERVAMLCNQSSIRDRRHVTR